MIAIHDISFEAECTPRTRSQYHLRFAPTAQDSLFHLPVSQVSPSFRVAPTQPPAPCGATAETPNYREHNVSEFLEH
jgi:hypothetical protein